MTINMMKNGERVSSSFYGSWSYANALRTGSARNKGELMNEDDRSITSLGTLIISLEKEVVELCSLLSPEAAV